MESGFFKAVRSSWFVVGSFSTPPRILKTKDRSWFCGGQRTADGKRFFTAVRSSWFKVRSFSTPPRISKAIDRSWFCGDCIIWCIPVVDGQRTKSSFQPNFSPSSSLHIKLAQAQHHRNKRCPAIELIHIGCLKFIRNIPIRRVPSVNDNLSVITSSNNVPIK